ncbi:MAG: putative dehydrogenase, partial [Parvicella sp.]
VDYRKVYSSSAEMGGGVHLDLIHEIDYTVFLMGMPKAAAFYGGKKSSLEISSYDVAHYALEYENSSVFITLNYYRRTAKRQIEVIWNDEEWTIDLLSNTIISSTQGIVLDEKFDLRETYKYQMQYFLSAIQNEEKAMNDFSESLEILGLCLNQKENAKG